MIATFSPASNFCFSSCGVISTGGAVSGRDIANTVARDLIRPNGESLPLVHRVSRAALHGRSGARQAAVEVLKRTDDRLADAQPGRPAQLLDAAAVEKNKRIISNPAAIPA